MVFNTPTFLFLFLPVVIICFLPIRHNIKLSNGVLLLASLVFYFWGVGWNSAVVIGMVIINHVCVRLLSACGEQRPGFFTTRRLLFAVAVSFNLGCLGFFKYSKFFVDNLNILLIRMHVSPLDCPSVYSPLAISFITFHVLSLVIDVYAGRLRYQKSITDTALHVLLFPKLLAGPIVRYDDMAPQLGHRCVDINKAASGLQRFIVGLAKKVLVADTLARSVDTLFLIPQDQWTCSAAWAAAIGYTLQIYFDFSGYSDMAIGLCRVFGFDITENFSYPYISKSIREFWQRWHISLSTWFRYYLYFPLGGNRCSRFRNYCNLTAVFMFCGLWHGASWTFVLWGAWHGFFMVAERFFSQGGPRNTLVPLRHLYALAVVIIGWVIFRSPTLSCAFAIVKAMFGFGVHQTDGNCLAGCFDAKILMAAAAGLFFSTPIAKSIAAGIAARQEDCGAFARGAVETARILMLCGMFILSVIEISGTTYSPFVYMQF